MVRIPARHDLVSEELFADTTYSPSLLNIVGEIWNKDSPEKSVHKIIQSLENDENSSQIFTADLAYGAAF